MAAEPLLSQQPRKFWIMSLAMLDKQAQQSSQIGCLKCGPRGPGRGAERCRDLHCQARGGGEGTEKDIRLALCGGPQSCPAVGARLGVLQGRARHDDHGLLVLSLPSGGALGSARPFPT